MSNSTERRAPRGPVVEVSLRESLGNETSQIVDPGNSPGLGKSQDWLLFVLDILEISSVILLLLFLEDPIPEEQVVIHFVLASFEERTTPTTTLIIP